MSWASEEPVSPPEPPFRATGCPGCGTATKDECICAECPCCGARLDGREDRVCGKCAEEAEEEAEFLRRLETLEESASCVS
jgi:hypothetical protein